MSETVSKRATWSLDEATGIHTVVLPTGATASYDLAKLYSRDWSELTSIDKQVFAYGCKQKQMDATAKSADMKLTDQERLLVFQEVYERLLAGDWSAKVDRASLYLRRCEDEAEMRLCIKIIPIVKEEDVARELLRREALA